MKKLTLAGLILSVLVFLAGIGFSQEKASQPQLRTEIIKLNYVDAKTVYSLLLGHVSREGHLSLAPEKRDLIVISDHPEIVEKVLAVIKEIDVKPVDLLFTVQLVLGSERADEKSDEGLRNDPVIKELSGLLRYKNFAVLDAGLIRAVDGKPARLTLGEHAEFVLDLEPKYNKQDKEETIDLDVELGAMTGPNQSTAAGQKETKPSFRNFVRTTLTLKSGDKAVVGVSKMDGGDKGLILIISGKIIN